MNIARGCPAVDIKDGISRLASKLRARAAGLRGAGAVSDDAAVCYHTWDDRSDVYAGGQVILRAAREL